MTLGRWVLAVGLVAVVGAVSLFSVQNSSRTTQLSFDLGVAAWELEQPAPLPAVIGASVGVGFLLGAAALGARVLAQGGKIRKLERDLAAADLRPKASVKASPEAKPRDGQAEDGGRW